MVRASGKDASLGRSSWYVLLGGGPGADRGLAGGIISKRLGIPRQSWWKDISGFPAETAAPKTLTNK